MKIHGRQTRDYNMSNMKNNITHKVMTLMT